MRTSWVLGLSLSLVSCAAEPVDESELASTDQSIIYGQDDRRDVYEDPDDVTRAIARNAVVALVPKARVQRAATGEVSLTMTALSAAYQLCQGERFADQPTAADCSGVLIDSDLVLTAGHCVQEAPCASYHYVFDYFYRAQGELEPISSNDVYGCRGVVAQEISKRDGLEVDYAVVQLDRAVTGRTPLELRTTPAQAEEPLTVLGTGSGLPIKVDHGARVIVTRAAERDYFALEADTFEGSSGSAIVDREGALLGILVRGGADYAHRAGANCNVVNRVAAAEPGLLPSGDLAHEEATYVTRAQEGVCRRDFPSQALCQRRGSCGDGFCSLLETRASCAEDCDPCQGAECARGDQRASAGASVKQAPASGLASDGSSCSVGAGSRRAALDLGALGWLAALGLQRRRRR